MSCHPPILCCSSLTPLLGNSEVNLETAEDQFFRVPVPDAVAAFEVRLFIVHLEFEIPAEIPVHTRGPSVGLFGRVTQVGKLQNESVIVNIQLRITAGQLDRSKASRAWIELPPGRD